VQNLSQRRLFLFSLTRQPLPFQYLTRWPEFPNRRILGQLRAIALGKVQRPTWILALGYENIRPQVKVWISFGDYWNNINQEFSTIRKARIRRISVRIFGGSKGGNGGCGQPRQSSRYCSPWDWLPFSSPMPTFIRIYTLGPSYLRPSEVLWAWCSSSIFTPSISIC